MICLRGPGTNLSLPQVLIGAAKGEGWGGGGQGTSDGGLSFVVICTDFLVTVAGLWYWYLISFRRDLSGLKYYCKYPCNPMDHILILLLSFESDRSEEPKAI